MAAINLSNVKLMIDDLAGGVHAYAYRTDGEEGQPLVASVTADTDLAAWKGLYTELARKFRVNGPIVAKGGFTLDANGPVKTR
jgi:hypothetical protein